MFRNSGPSTIILSENGCDVKKRNPNDIILNLSEYTEDIRNILLKYSTESEEYPGNKIIQSYTQNKDLLIKCLKFQESPQMIIGKMLLAHINGQTELVKALMKDLPDDYFLDNETRALFSGFRQIINPQNTTL